MSKHEENHCPKKWTKYLKVVLYKFSSKFPYRAWNLKNNIAIYYYLSSTGLAKKSINNLSKNI